MNILIPDLWLRDHLKTSATPKQLAEYLSLSGPSIERINSIDGEIVYDIEITSNRVDSYSVRGIAREAHAILPEYGIKSDLIPVELTDFSQQSIQQLPAIPITVENNPDLIQRIVAVVIRNVRIMPSPDLMAKKLMLSGQRPLNSIIDITNYVMWEMGHPIHAFDLDRLSTGIIQIREAKHGEHVITLDGKNHTMLGGEIIFDDGRGTIIDLPGIMGTANTVVTPDTKNVLLFIENSDPVKIRQASMGHSIRTQAAVINEKHPDAALALETLKRAAYLTVSCGAGEIGSRLFDTYRLQTDPKPIELPKKMLVSYLGTDITDDRVCGILTRLGCQVRKKKTAGSDIVYSVLAPPERHDDMNIPQDIIEEVARIYGYHKIAAVIPTLPSMLPKPDSTLVFEQSLKNLLSGFGMTELYSYSMISDDECRTFHYDTDSVYTIDNPLSGDLVHMRPSLIPGVIKALSQNQFLKNRLAVFELSMIYRMREADLPDEVPSLVVGISGPDAFRRLKGIVESLLGTYGIVNSGDIPGPDVCWLNRFESLTYGQYASLGMVSQYISNCYGLKTEAAVSEIHLTELLTRPETGHTYTPPPKYPIAAEDLSFIVPEDFLVGNFMKNVRNAHTAIKQVKFNNAYQTVRTFTIMYGDDTGNMTAEKIREAREAVLSWAKSTYGLVLKMA